MDQNMNEKNTQGFPKANRPAAAQEDSIDLLKIAKELSKNITAIILAFLIGAGAAFAYTELFVSPTYTSTAMIYVNTNTFSLGSTTISASQLNLSSSLVSRYRIILKSRKVINAVIREANLPYSYNTVSNMVSANDVEQTGIMSITVTDTDPIEAELIANTIVQVLPDAISDIIEGTAVKIVDYAVIPTVKSGPNILRNSFMGGAALAALVCAVFVFISIIDDTIRSEDDLIEAFDLPILASIPDHSSGNGKGSYGYYYSAEGKKKRKKKKLFESKSANVSRAASKTSKAFTEEEEN